ncbi:MAG TPA: acylphosphatase [Cyclobacteriaceae bacterium]
MKHVSLKVSGKVQGVFFRASTIDVAEKFGINGFVRNEHDGSVYIEAEGEEENLKQFVEWCRHGPARAKVSNVDLKEGSVQWFTKFEIRR